MAAAPPTPDKKPRQIGTGIKLGGGFAVLAVIAVGYYAFSYTDLANAIKTSKDKYAQLQVDDSNAREAFTLYTIDSNKLEEKKAKSREFNKALPEQSDVAAYVSSLNQQAEIAGLKLRVIQPQDEQPQPFYTRVPVQLQVQGRFHQIAKFFAGIGRLDRIVNVENITLTNPKVGDNDETTLSTSCLTTTFHANKPVGTPAAPGAPKK